MYNLKNLLGHVLVLFLSLGVWQPVLAAVYPNKPLRIVMAFTPGAAADLTIRLMQTSLEKQLGQPIIVEYKSGAGGVLAVQTVARAQPDGYTLLLAATNSFVIDQYLQPRTDFDPLASLTPVIKIVEVPGVLFTNKKMQVQDWNAFKEKARSVATNFGTPGIGTTPHLSLLQLARSADIAMTHIPYRGGQPAIQALLANDVQLYLGNYAPLTQFISEGRVNALAVVASQRLKALPNVPTVKEAGLPDVLSNNWFMLAAPVGTPSDVINTLARGIKEVLATPELKEKYVEQGFVISADSGQKLQDDLLAESKKWRDLISAEKLAEPQEGKK